MWFTVQGAIAETPAPLLGVPSPEAARDFLGWYVIWEVLNWLRSPEGHAFVVAFGGWIVTMFGGRRVPSLVWRERVRIVGLTLLGVAALTVVLGVADGSFPLSEEARRATMMILLALVMLGIGVAVYRHVIHELQRLVLAGLRIVDTPTTVDEPATYRLKMYVAVANETSHEIEVGIPFRWVGKALHHPPNRPVGEIASSLQLWECDKWTPKDSATTLRVPAGRVFHFWLGFHPSFNVTDLEQAHAKTRLGSFTLPVVISGRKYEWSKAL